MADILFRYPEMTKAAEEITGIATRYKTEAEKFEESFLSAINGWEGDSRDAMQKFISGPVMEYLRDTVPQLLEALSQLLDENATQMKSADTGIAEKIPETLG